MEEVKLNRTGQRPIAFMGEELYRGTTKENGSTRWDNVLVYLKQDGGYIIGIARLTCWEETEHDKYEVTKAKGKDEVIEIIMRSVPDLDTKELIEKLHPDWKPEDGRRKTDEENRSNEPSGN